MKPGIKTYLFDDHVIPFNTFGASDRYMCQRHWHLHPARQVYVLALLALTSRASDIRAAK